MSRTIHSLAALVTSNISGFERGMRAAAKVTGELATAWSRAASDVGSAATRVGLAVAGVGAGIAKTIATLESTMTRAGAVTRTLGTRDFEALNAAAKKMGEETVFSANQAAEAIHLMGLAGLSTQEIITALPGALELAASAQVSIAEAADVAAKNMRAFGLGAQELGRINDVLVGTFTRSNTDIRSLAEAMKHVAPVSKALNVSIEETAAVLGKMGDAGFQGSIAGTSLRNIMTRLAGAVPQATRKLQELGVETLDASGKMRPLLDILADIERQAISEAQVLEIFGARGGPQMLALLEVGTGAIRKFSTELEGMGGVTKEIAQANLATLSGKFTLLRSEIEAVVVAAGEELKPTFHAVIQSVRDFLKENRHEIVDQMARAVRSLADMFVRLTQWARGNSGGLREIARTFLDWFSAITKFLSEHPRLAAMLALLKASSLLGISQAVRSVASAFIALGGAMGQANAAGGTLGGTLGKFGRHGAFVGVAVAGVLYLLDLFEKLGEKAERLSDQMERMGNIGRQLDESRGRQIDQILAEAAKIEFAPERSAMLQERRQGQVGLLARDNAKQAQLQDEINRKEEEIAELEKLRLAAAAEAVVNPGAIPQAGKAHRAVAAAQLELENLQQRFDETSDRVKNFERGIQRLDEAVQEAESQITDDDKRLIRANIEDGLPQFTRLNERQPQKKIGLGDLGDMTEDQLRQIPAARLSDEVLALLRTTQGGAHPEEIANAVKGAAPDIGAGVADGIAARGAGGGGGGGHGDKTPADLIRDAKEGAWEKSSPGFGQLREFIGMKGVGAGDAMRFMSLMPGANVDLMKSFGQQVGDANQLRPENREQRLDEIAFEFAAKLTQAVASSKAADEAAKFGAAARDVAGIPGVQPAAVAPLVQGVQQAQAGMVGGQVSPEQFAETLDAARHKLAELAQEAQQSATATTDLKAKLTEYTQAGQLSGQAATQLNTELYEAQAALEAGTMSHDQYNLKLQEIGQTAQQVAASSPAAAMQDLSRHLKTLEMSGRLTGQQTKLFRDEMQFLQQMFDKGKISANQLSQAIDVLGHKASAAAGKMGGGGFGGGFGGMFPGMPPWMQQVFQMGFGGGQPVQLGTPGEWFQKAADANVRNMGGTPGGGGFGGGGAVAAPVEKSPVQKLAESIGSRLAASEPFAESLAALGKSLASNLGRTIEGVSALRKGVLGAPLDAGAGSMPLSALDAPLKGPGKIDARNITLEFPSMTKLSVNDVQTIVEAIRLEDSRQGRSF